MLPAFLMCLWACFGPLIYDVAHNTMPAPDLKRGIRTARSENPRYLELKLATLQDREKRVKNCRTYPIQHQISVLHLAVFARVIDPLLIFCIADNVSITFFNAAVSRSISHRLLGSKNGMSSFSDEGPSGMLRHQSGSCSFM